MKIIKSALTMLAVAMLSQAGFSQMNNGKEKTVEVGGAAMYPSKNIVQNAVNSKDHTTLVKALQAASGQNDWGQSF